MKSLTSISSLFYVGCLYDLILGLLFALVPVAVFNWYDIVPPNHLGYVQFPALLLLVFALMFWNAARKPVENRILVPYMILFKLSFAIVVILYWIAGDVPALWKPFAIFDLIFAAAFYWVYGKLAVTRTA